MMWDEDYILGETPDADETDAEVAFLLEALELTAEDYVLDVACGAGRHAARIAAEGPFVVGIDASGTLLESAPRGERVAYLRADMRALPFDAAFDVAVCLFASFGLFDDAGNRAALASMAGALRTDGVLLIETWNPFAAAELDGRRNWWRAGDRLYLGHAEYDPLAGVVRDHRTILDLRTGDSKSWVRTTRFYTAPELASMAAAVHLEPLRWFGDFDGSDYTSESPRLIAVFEKVAR